jgi:hypothetical protein
MARKDLASAETAGLFCFIRAIDTHHPYVNILLSYPLIQLLCNHIL